MTLDPPTIRLLGTDERSILHIVLRSQETQTSRRAKVPYGVTLSNDSILETLTKHHQDKTLLIFPGETATWEKTAAAVDTIIMYCPLNEKRNNEMATQFKGEFYQDHHRRDLSILELVHSIDSAGLVVQKD